MKDENIVAICDVDEERANGSLKQFKEKYPEEAGRAASAKRWS